MRIIAGKHRGKKLSQFNLDHIRPTSDIVKEAMFNSLQTIIKDSVFLDLFGGTGSVGLEAYSRGAKSVYICDNNINSIKLIKKNNALISGQANVIFSDYEKAINNFAKEKIKFDIIFIDPPYLTNFGERAIEFIYKHNILNNDGIIVFEHHKNKEFKVPEFCELVNEKKYGIKKVLYLEIIKEWNYDKNYKC